MGETETKNPGMLLTSFLSWLGMVTSKKEGDLSPHTSILYY